MSETFDAEWLDLREGFDALARSEALAAALIAALPARPRLLDLGAGTGSLFRWLAPRIGRAQAWTLVDADAWLIEDAFRTIAERTTALGLRVTWPGKRTLLVHAPGGAWRVEGVIADLAQAPHGLPLAQTDAVVSSALCDLVSADWVARMAATLRVPFYAALCVDGRDRFAPADAADAQVARWFRRDQGRDKGFGPALGARAPAAIAAAFSAAGFAVRSARSDWVLRPRWFGLPPALRAEARRFVTTLTDGHARAALRHAPHAARSPIALWSVRRAYQSRTHLGLRIGHRDVLALPA